MKTFYSLCIYRNNRFFRLFWYKSRSVAGKELKTKDFSCKTEVLILIGGGETLFQNFWLEEYVLFTVSLRENIWEYQLMFNRNIKEQASQALRKAALNEEAKKSPVFSSKANIEKRILGFFVCNFHRSKAEGIRLLRLIIVVMFKIGG